MNMNEPINEKPVMSEPSQEYGLREAVIDTNAAVQRLAELVSQTLTVIQGISNISVEEGGEQ